MVSWMFAVWVQVPPELFSRSAAAATETVECPVIYQIDLRWVWLELNNGDIMPLDQLLNVVTIDGHVMLDGCQSGMARARSVTYSGWVAVGRGNDLPTTASWLQSAGFSRNRNQEGG